MQHKVLIYGNGLYKEISIGDAKNISIGTDKRCQIWITSDMFDKPFVLKLEIDDKIKLYTGSVLKLKNQDSTVDSVDINLAEKVDLYYRDNDNSLFTLEVIYDFEDLSKDYHFSVDIRNQSRFVIGTNPSADIRVIDDAIDEAMITLEKENGSLELTVDVNKAVVSHNGAYLTDEHCTINNKDFFSVGSIQFWFSDGFLYTTEDDRVVSKLTTDIVREQNNQLKYPEFIKNVRLQFKQNHDEIEVLQPSAKPQMPEGNLLEKILPTVVMMLMMAVMRFMMRSNVIYAIYFVAMMVMTTAMTTISFMREKKKTKEKELKRQEIYSEYIAKKDVEIQTHRQDERLIAQKMKVLPQETVVQIENFDARLFEKDKTHDDFLNVPIGTGTIDSANQISYKKQEYVETEDPLMDIPSEMYKKYEKLENMPVDIQLKHLNAVGFLGTRTKLYQMAKNLIITIAGQHFYQDVKFFIMLNEEDVPFFDWIRWLQNFSTDGNRNILFDEGSKKSVLEAIYNELSSRENLKETELKNLPHYIVFAYRSEHMNGHPITKYVRRAKELGFTFLFFEEYKELIHEACDELVCLDRETYDGFIQSTENAAETQNFSYPHLNGDTVAAAALKLACVHVNEVSLESTLTKNITLYQLLKIMTAYDLNVGQRWKQSNIYESMAAPLGVDSSGSLVYLDLHEKAHGPHGLVAGTTGSGKSELLQSYVLSMCTMFHPYEVGFVIIDFKGGGMANQFKDLPHLNGAITNIDGKQIDRSLMSIKAELMKRQRLFAEHNVNKIDDYIDLFKKGEAKIPLPHLILIVDEFAELKSDQPEFMKELISAARIGRSLGMHLILATQKPAGVVNDQIWSNSRFKLCLKVQDKSDSKEVLKSPLAAEIREPGRCYLQVGNNEIFMLFQSAYSGASVNVEQMEQQKKFEINSVDFAGRKQTIYSQKPQKAKGNGETQLDAIVTYIADYCKENDIRRLPDICLPPLAEVIPFPDAIATDSNETDIILPVGIFDNPSEQFQGELTINLTKDNTYVVGSSLSGKTNFLQVVIKGLCEKYSAADVCIYIVDFASMMLKNFDKLNQVGGVVTLSEDTKFRQLLEMLLGVIEERKQILSDKGLSSFSAYREAGLTDLKQIVLMIENYSMLHAVYGDYEGAIGNICRDGLAVGISVIITNPMSTGLGMRMMTYFGEKISLYQNDSSQYNLLLDHCKLHPDNNPGRGVLSRDNSIREFQTYLAFSAEKEVEKVGMIREFVRATNDKNKGIIAAAIPTIPESVNEEYLMNQYGYDESVYANNTIPFGIRYEDIQTELVSLEKENFISITGQDELGRSAFIKYLLEHLRMHSSTQPVELYIVDDISRELEYVKDWPITKAYTTSQAEVESIIKTVFEEAKSRYGVMTSSANALVEKPLTLLIFNSSLTEDIIGVSQASVQMHELLVSKLKGTKVCIMHSRTNNVAINFKSSAVAKLISETSTMVAFEEPKGIKVVSVPSAVTRNATKKMEYGDAYYIKNGAFIKMRMTLKTLEKENTNE